MRRRYREPVVIAFALALIASLSVHLPVYEVLGGLADRFRMEAEEAKKTQKFDPVEVDFEVADSTKSERARKKPRQREQAKREQLAKAVQAQAQQQAEQQQKPTQPPIERATGGAATQHEPGRGARRPAVHRRAEQSGRRGNRRPDSQHDPGRPDAVARPSGEAVGHPGGAGQLPRAASRRGSQQGGQRRAQGHRRGSPPQAPGQGD